MKTKEHQLDLRWLEAYRSQDPHFGLERMEALGFERKSSPRLSGLFMLRGPMAKALPLLPCPNS